MQCAYRTTTHHHSQFVRAQAHALTQGIASLQGEGAQAQRHCEACTFLRVRQGVHDAGIGQCFAATRRGHVDAEETLLFATDLQGSGQVEGFVLPRESGTATALLESAVVVNAGQAGIELGQAAGDAVSALFNTNQVFV